VDILEVGVLILPQANTRVCIPVQGRTHPLAMIFHSNGHSEKYWWLRGTYRVICETPGDLQTTATSWHRFRRRNLRIGDVSFVRLCAEYIKPNLHWINHLSRKLFRRHIVRN